MSGHQFFQKLFNPMVYKHCRVRYFCNNTLIASKDLKHAAPPDILMNKFKHATSTMNILDTVHQHDRVMNAKHIMQALRTIFVLQKEGRSELSTKEIIKHKNFARLCGRLKSLAGVIDINETIEALKVVTYIGVPKDSTIAHVLLQLIRHNINELSLSNIMFLEFLLGNYSKVPLAEALKIALPIVFEIQLPMKIDKDNILSLREYLFYAARNKLSEKTLNLILSSMLKCKDLSDAKTAKSIIWSLTDLPPSTVFEPLVSKNIETLLVHIDELSFDDLDTTLSKLTAAYRYEYPFFGNKLFCDAVVGHIIDNDAGYEKAIYCMKKLDRLGFTNKYLIDYVAKKVQDCPEEFQNDSFGIYVFMKYLSRTHYRPSNWENMSQLLENSEESIVGESHILKLTASLCYLQIFNENLLSKLFSEDLEAKFRRRKSHVYLFLTIYHSLKLYRPQLLKLIPKHIRSKDLIQYLILPEEFPLQTSLHSAFGGEKYVKSGIYSKEGIFIDHAIIFRKGGYPVATNFKSTFIEDVEISQDNQLVLIMCLHPSLYNQENHLKIAPTMGIRLLEDLGYLTVPICFSNWNSFPDYEKIPYLVQNIKDKLGDDMMIVNNVA